MPRDTIATGVLTHECVSTPSDIPVMQTPPIIALVGDYNPTVTAHQAIPRALERAEVATGRRIAWQWVPTAEIATLPAILLHCHGIWAVPASPYQSMTGALTAIRHARAQGVPFLGTCGGFQHALIEFARNVAGIPDADHAETNAQGSALVVSPLACSLVEQTGELTFTPGSRLFGYYSGQSAREGYHCNYGLNPFFRTRLEAAGLRFTAYDRNGEVRAFELPGHPFFIGTLFQPERSALQHRTHPLIYAFVEAVLAGGMRTESVLYPTPP
jgi:CTP synthase (UTP-ammonia lyase)